MTNLQRFISIKPTQCGKNNFSVFPCIVLKAISYDVIFNDWLYGPEIITQKVTYFQTFRL